MGVLDRFKHKIVQRKARNKRVKAARAIRQKKAEAVYFQELEKEEIRRAKVKAKKPRGYKSLVKSTGNLAKNLAARQARPETGKLAAQRQNALFGNTNPQAAIFGTKKQAELPRKTLKPKKKVVYEY